MANYNNMEPLVCRREQAQLQTRYLFNPSTIANYNNMVQTRYLFNPAKIVNYMEPLICRREQAQLQTRYLFNPAKMANYNNMAVGSAMEIDRLSALPDADEFLPSIQGFGTQPLIFNPWKMPPANYNNVATTEVVGSAMEVDRLSALPDELLVDILGRLDNPNHNMKEAARTAALCKRWRFLWTKLPVFSFSIPIQIRGIAGSSSFGGVGEALAARKKAATLEEGYYCKCSFRLYISLYYDNFLIALLDLASDGDVDLNPTAYKRCSLPLALYSYPSLRMLSLEYLNLLLPPAATSVDWGLMTEISLLRVHLPQQALDQILSGCPLLSRLGVRNCSGFDRLDVRGCPFRNLDVAYNSSHFHLLEISAPYMTSLNVYMNPRRTKLRLTDVSSVEQLSIGFDYDPAELRLTEEMFRNNNQLFQLLQRLTALVLDHNFFEVLSNRIKKGGQRPQCRVQHLTILDDIDRDNIIGVLAILESSPFLEKLVIRDACRRSHISDQDPDVDLICDLLHLKTVEIIFDIGRQRPHTLSFTLAQILLRRAPVLEEMVIRVEKISKSFDYSELFSELVKKFNALLTNPKSSPKAVIYISF